MKALAPQHPEWKTQEPFASLLTGDMTGVLAGGEKIAARLIVAATHAGMTTDEFEHDRQGVARHREASHDQARLYTEMVYQPMLELLAYLRANGFKTFIVSGGGVEFMRPSPSSVYGIPPEQVIGSSGKLKFEMRDGKPVLVKLPEVALRRRQGRQADRHSARHRPPPDRRVRQFRRRSADAAVDRPPARARASASIVHHTDADREWAYDRHSHVGRLDKALMTRQAKGWTVVSMKDDWKTIFPAE